MTTDNPDVVLPAGLLAHMVGQGGALGITHRDIEGEWLVGYEFGQEAEDSPMAGGAAYATAGTLTEAVAAIVGQLRLPVVEEGSDAQA